MYHFVHPLGPALSEPSQTFHQVSEELPMGEAATPKEWRVAWRQKTKIILLGRPGGDTCLLLISQSALHSLR